MFSFSGAAWVSWAKDCLLPETAFKGLAPRTDVCSPECDDGMERSVGQCSMRCLLDARPSLRMNEEQKYTCIVGWKERGGGMSDNDLLMRENRML